MTGQYPCGRGAAQREAERHKIHEGEKGVRGGAGCTSVRSGSGWRVEVSAHRKEAKFCLVLELSERNLLAA